MFCASLTLLLLGPKALMLARVLLRNRPRWKKIRLCAHFFSRGFQGPAMTSNSANTRLALNCAGTGMRRIFLGLSLVAVWKMPVWSNTTGLGIVVAGFCAFAAASAGLTKATCEVFASRVT